MQLRPLLDPPRVLLLLLVAVPEALPVRPDHLPHITSRLGILEAGPPATLVDHLRHDDALAATADHTLLESLDALLGSCRFSVQVQAKTIGIVVLSVNSQHLCFTCYKKNIDQCYGVWALRSRYRSLQGIGNRRSRYRGEVGNRRSRYRSLQISRA
jgi:hypothetical protein